jgi:hypothetical protein
MPCARAHVNQGVAISTGYEPLNAPRIDASALCATPHASGRPCCRVLKLSRLPVMMMPFICSFRNKNEPTAIYPGTQYKVRRAGLMTSTNTSESIYSISVTGRVEALQAQSGQKETQEGHSYAKRWGIEPHPLTTWRQNQAMGS